jgi:cell division protein FtsX
MLKVMAISMNRLRGVNNVSNAEIINKESHLDSFISMSNTTSTNQDFLRSLYAEKIVKLNQPNQNSQ